MKWIAAVLTGTLSLSAYASTPAAPTPAAPQAKKSESAASGATLTLETLDRYIAYRRESDPLTLEASNKLLQGGSEGKSMMQVLEGIKKQDEVVQAKHGLPTGADFSKLDRMVRDICDARFTAESPVKKSMLERFEAQANGPASPERDMAKGMVAMLRKDMQTGAQLVAQRKDYGDATVDLVLKREKELKEIWAKKEAAANRALDALP